MAVFEVRSDESRNRLYIKLSNHISAEVAEECSRAVIVEVEKLQDGFDIINDISEFKLSNFKAIIIASRMMKYLKKKKVSQVIRVVGSSKSGIIQFSRAANMARAYSAKFVSSLAEAENLLDEKFENA